MTRVTGKPIGTERAIDWVRGSLAQGSGLAALVGGRLVTLTKAVLLVAPSRVRGADPVLDDVGRGVPAAESNELAQCLLARVGESAVFTLLVEDDLARRGDPHVGRAVFVGDRVVRWAENDRKTGSAAELLRRGASGYPLNAYLCEGTPTELGLALNRDLSLPQQERLAEATRAVIVSVWDAEAFVAVLARELTS